MHDLQYGLFSLLKKLPRYFRMRKYGMHTKLGHLVT
jgi:hypothetical protein